MGILITKLAIKRFVLSSDVCSSRSGSTSSSMGSLRRETHIFFYMFPTAHGFRAMARGPDRFFFFVCLLYWATLTSLINIPLIWEIGE